MTNSVQVDPGGATFPTITAALASITDASVDKQYELWVSEGTFDEQITLEPYVTVRGAGPDKTTITHLSTEEYGRSGTVNAASNSAIESATIVSTGTTWGTFTIAVYVAQVAPFAISNCVLESNPDNAEGQNPTALAVNLQEFGSAAEVDVSYCKINSSNFGIGVGDLGGVTVNESSVTAQGGGQTWGAFTSGSAKLELIYCKITGKDFALNVDSPGSSITAINCTIDGPLGGNPKIVNDPPPSG